MSIQSNTPKQNDGGKQKMVVTTFRLPENWLLRLKDKLGPLAVPSRMYRVLVGMYLDGKIEVTDDDIKKYSQ